MEAAACTSDVDARCAGPRPDVGSPEARLRTVPLTRPLEKAGLRIGGLARAPPRCLPTDPAHAVRWGPVPEPRCHCSAIPDCTRRPPAQTGRFAAWPARAPGQGRSGPRREGPWPRDVDRGFFAGVHRAVHRDEGGACGDRGGPGLRGRGDSPECDRRRRAMRTSTGTGCTKRRFGSRRASRVIPYRDTPGQKPQRFGRRLERLWKQRKERA